MWTDNEFVSVSTGDDQVKLTTTGNNDEAVSDWQAIPEFHTILLPTTGILAMFAIIRKKKLLNEK